MDNLPDAPTPLPIEQAQVLDVELTDEEAARQARDQYRESGVPSVAIDDSVAPHLEDGEAVLGHRSPATLARIDETMQAAVREEGRLYVTDRRLLHIGQQPISVPLADIEELAMADDRILLTIAGARGVMLDVSEPRQFRVLLAAARSALRD